MKVLHVPFTFYPDPCGGTEVYVDSLAHHMQEMGFDAVVAAPGRENSDRSYTHNGIKVWRFAPGQDSDLQDLYGEGNLMAAETFGRILDIEQPDMVHLHAFTSAASLRLVREAKRRGTPVVFTYHTPTVSCQRGTLMRWDSEVCDGRLDVGLCAQCTLHGLGMPRKVAGLVGRVPVFAGETIGALRWTGRAWTALRMRELVSLRHASFRGLMAEADHIVTLCEWAREILLLNGIPSDKVTLSRHGLLHPTIAAEHQARQVEASARPLKIAFLGRLDSAKGVDLLISALRGLPEAPVEVHLYGIVQEEGGSGYLQQLRDLSRNDSRITFHPPAPNDQVISLLRNYHLLAVPSRCLETGPLVVLEAFAAGTPVIGSNLGGIGELVEHEVNGLLVEPDLAAGWSQAFRRFLEEPGLLEMLRNGVPAPRSMSAVAREMAALYRSLVDSRQMTGSRASREL